MNIHTKVFTFMLIGINVGCLGTDMFIQEHSNVFEITFSKDNIEQYIITLAKEPTTNHKHSIALRIPGTKPETGTIDASEFDRLQTQINELFKQVRPGFEEAGGVQFFKIETTIAPEVTTLYKDIFKLCKKEFRNFTPTPLEASAQEATEQREEATSAETAQLSLPITLATLVVMYMIPDASGITSITYSSTSPTTSTVSPIAISTNNVPMNEYFVTINTTNKTISVDFRGNIRSLHVNDATIKTITTCINAILKNKLNFIFVPNIGNNSWSAYLYNYIYRIAVLQFKNELFSQVRPPFNIPQADITEIEKQISASLNSQPISSSWFNLEGLSQKAANLKKSLWQTLWSNRLRRAATIGTTTIGIGAIAAYYYLYPKPGK
jgi:hypothetical protein